MPVATVAPPRDVCRRAAGALRRARLKMRAMAIHELAVS